MCKRIGGVCEKVITTTFFVENLHASGRSGNQWRHLLERSRDGVCGVAAGGVFKRFASDALQAQQLLQLCEAAQHLCTYAKLTRILLLLLFFFGKVFYSYFIQLLYEVKSKLVSLERSVWGTVWFQKIVISKLVN